MPARDPSGLPVGLLQASCLLTNNHRQTMITITREHSSTGSRYEIDALLCPAGWAQLDSPDDASWYGTWAHPKHRSIVSYCEGDIARSHADTAEEFTAEVRRINRFHQHEGGIRIDPCSGDRQLWEALGLADLLA